MLESMCLYMFWFPCLCMSLPMPISLHVLLCVMESVCMCADVQYATDTRCQWAQAPKPQQAGNFAVNGLHSTG